MTLSPPSLPLHADQQVQAFFFSLLLIFFLPFLTIVLARRIRPLCLSWILFSIETVSTTTMTGEEETLVRTGKKEKKGRKLKGPCDQVWLSPIQQCSTTFARLAVPTVLSSSSSSSSSSSLLRTNNNNNTEKKKKRRT